MRHQQTMKHVTWVVVADGEGAAVVGRGAGAVVVGAGALVLDVAGADECGA